MGLGGRTESRLSGLSGLLNYDGYGSRKRSYINSHRIAIRRLACHGTYVHRVRTAPVVAHAVMRENFELRDDFVTMSTEIYKYRRRFIKLMSMEMSDGDSDGDL